MSTETLTKLNPKILINSKLDPNGLDITSSDPKISNKDKICINKLTDRLKKKENNKKFENRVLSGLFLGVVAVLFFIAT